MCARDLTGTFDAETSYSASIERLGLLRMDQVERAKEYFFKALDSLENREFENAERYLSEALKLTPRSIPALNNLAISQFEQTKFADAALTARKVLNIDSKNIDALVMVSTCQNVQGHYDGALVTCQEIIGINPGFAEAHCNLGIALKQTGKYREAIESFDRAIGLNPQLADAFLNRGNTFCALKRYDEALASYDSAIILKSDIAEAWVGRGNVFAATRRYNEAFECFLRAQHIAPELGEANYNEGIYRLLLGDYERGWKKYEARRDLRLPHNIANSNSRPLWLGNSSIADKTIMLRAEQGLGDTIMASRYVPMVAELGARVVLEVQAPLRSLFRSLEGVSALVAAGDEISEFDCQCPLMSLPLAFKTRLDTIPNKVPYLTPSADIVQKWHARVGGGEFKVGVAWAGNSNFINDRERSILLENILPVSAIVGVKCMSIQKDLRPGDQQLLNANPQIVQLGKEISDFQDAAAIVMSLDLIISVDTSVVHLAGALARPVWVLLPFNPDWRWLLGRTDSPWYPTAKLFRQTKDGDWASVITSVCEELKKQLGTHSPDTLHGPNYA
jgi:tetratricopeptide (TPR) repeat protein